MTDIVIVSAARTAVGTFGGTLKNVSGLDLAVHVIRAAVERAGLAGRPEVVDDVILGNCLQRSDEINIARTAWLKAGLPFTTPGVTIQRQCSSGLQAIIFAAQKIKAGDADVVLAGGVESMSTVPYMLPALRWGAQYRHVQAVDMLYQGLTDPLLNCQMGITAENLAKKYGITRREQDEYALRSQQNAAAAIRAGRFKNEIVPFTLREKKKEIVFDTDEHVRPEATMESLAKLSPVFETDGTVTAGNAAGLNDGAAALIVTSAAKAAELGLTPLARLTGYAVAGVEPELMGYGPVPAIRKLLARTAARLDDFDLIEVNEAFAAQYLAVEKLLELDRTKVNTVGSGISLGHPVGATGARIVVTLLHQLQHTGGRRGLASLCVGGGMGVAASIERLD